MQRFSLYQGDTMSPIVYENLVICFIGQSDIDRYKINILKKYIVKDDFFLAMGSISEFCRWQDINYLVHFYWREDYPFISNIKNYIKYIAWRLSELRYIELGRPLFSHKY